MASLADLTQPKLRSNRERHAVELQQLRRSLLAFKAAKHVAGELELAGYYAMVEEHLTHMIQVSEREAKRAGS